MSKLCGYKMQGGRVYPTGVARGSVQKSALNRMIDGRSVRNPAMEVRGRAKQYAGRYASAFGAMLDRLRHCGYKIARTPGPRGGEWSATYRITNGPLAGAFGRARRRQKR